MHIYPAILTDSLIEVQQQVAEVAILPDMTGVQVDIIDGRFADNLTVTPSDLVDIDFAQLQVDFHLMVEEPMDSVFELIEHKDALPVRAVIGQVERMSNQQFFLEEVEKNEWLPGLSLDIFTPVDAIEPASWQYLKVVQLMAVEAGFQGQTFNTLVIRKLDELRSFIATHDLEIEVIVDGAMSPETSPLVAKAGATGIAIGSAFWHASDKTALLAALQTV